MFETTIDTRASIITALGELREQVGAHFAAIPAEHFVEAAGDAWSPAQNLEHMIKAADPVRKALGMPKEALQQKFGLAEQPAQSFEQLQERYRQALASGASASGRYLPTQEGAASPDQQQQELLRSWNELAEGLQAALAGWQEAELDRYCLPHPIIGKLSMREMLYFTIYHWLCHISAGGD